MGKEKRTQVCKDEANQATSTALRTEAFCWRKSTYSRRNATWCGVSIALTLRRTDQLPLQNDDGSTHLLLLRITSITLSITFIAPTIPSPSLALTNPILIIQQHATNPALPIPPRQCARTDSPLSV